MSARYSCRFIAKIEPRASFLTKFAASSFLSGFCRPLLVVVASRAYFLPVASARLSLLLLLALQSSHERPFSRIRGVLFFLWLLLSFYGPLLVIVTSQAYLLESVVNLSLLLLMHVTSLIKLYKIASYELFFIDQPECYTSRSLSLPSLPGLFLCHHHRASRELIASGAASSSSFLAVTTYIHRHRGLKV